MKENNKNLTTTVSKFPHTHHTSLPPSNQRHCRYPSLIMADNEDLDFKALLNTVRKTIKKAAVKSGQGSPAQASTSQPETKESTPSPSQGPKFQVKEVKYNNRVGRVAFLNCCDGAMNAAMASVGGGEPTNHGEPADGNEGGGPDSSNDSPLPDFDVFMTDTDNEAGTPSEANEGGARLSMNEVMMLGQRMLSGMTTASEKSCCSDNPPVQRGTKPPDHAPDSSGGRPAEPAQKASIRGYQKPNASPLRNENRGSPADDDQQASQHSKTENGTATSSPDPSKRGERGASPLQDGSKETPPFNSSANPMLEDSKFRSVIALTARVEKFIAKYMLKDTQPNSFLKLKERLVVVMLYLRQLGTSAEDYSTLPDQALVKAFAFAGDEEARDLMRRAGWEIIFLRQAPPYQERATDENAIPVFGKPVQAAKIDKPTASAHLPTKSGVHKKLGKAAQKNFEGIDMSLPRAREGSNADEYLTAPILSLEGRIFLCLHPSSGSNQLKAGEILVQGTELSADEWEKIPNEFRNLDRKIIVACWDLASNPVIRKRVLDYKRVLALTGFKEDEMLDEPNKLLAALVDIQEAETRKGVEPVAVSENKTSEHKVGGSAMTEDFMERSGTKILAAALLEIDKSLLDPSYKTTTARENFALSKGVKLNSVEVYEFFHHYQKLRTSYYSSTTNTTRGDNKMPLLEQMALLELKVFDNGKDKESGPAMGEASSSEVKGKEGDLLVEEASAIGKAKAKGKKKSGKGGKKKKSKLLMDDAATDKGKERDMLVEGSTVDEVKGKGKELPLLEDATAGKGRAKESNVLVKDQANGKGKGKANDLPVKDTTSGKGKEGDQSSSSGFRKFKLTLDLNTEPQLTPSSFLVLDLGGSRPTVDDVTEIFSKFSATKEHYLAARTSLLCFMNDKVRPQEASSDELDDFCQILSAQVVFEEMSLVIEELEWNR